MNVNIQKPKHAAAAVVKPTTVKKEIATAAQIKTNIGVKKS